ncbi:MAG TPA: PHB depolymerase family esterase [Acidimicrobiia bacterium]|nr:PHB depolymerase family esterase [Acidimicrobiia bacterium]
MRRWLASISLIGALMAGAVSLPSAGPAVAGAAVPGVTVPGVTVPGVTAGSPTANRPYGLEVPPGVDGQHQVPLVVSLHGYTSNGATQVAYFGLIAEADKEGFLLAYPDGTRNTMGNRFWNATDACCDFFHSGVDDVAYLDAMIAEISAKYPVDPSRVFLVGHSNGAFMAHRYACDRAGKVAAIVTLAGMTWKDQGRCPAGSPLSVLQVHGRNDGTINYEGGATPSGAYPGAVETVGDWARKDGCTGSLAATGRKFDLDRTVVGDETVEEAYSGCPSGSGVALWTIEGGGHVPAFNEHWAESIWSFMSTHPKGSSPS